MADASPAAPAGGALVVWDFDWSMINENSDTYVVEHSNAEVYARMRSLRASMPWTALMDSSFAELHRVGVTRPAIEALLARIPVFDEVPALIRELAAAGVRQWIVSDANTELIRIILASHGLADCFDTVVTNPAVWTEDGRLSVSPFHPATAPPHACPRCPENLCKGDVLDSLLCACAERPSPILYVGDGGGDLCPCLRLRAGDRALARSGFALETKLAAALAKGEGADPSILRVWHDGATLAAEIRAHVRTA